MRARPRLAREKPGAFRDYVDAEILPGQLGRIPLRHDADGVAVHDQRAALHAHGPLEGAVRGVVFEKVGIRLRVAQIVQRDELQAVLLAALVMRPQDVAPDAPKTVDCNLDHRITLLTTFATFSGVKPKCLKRCAAGADSP